MAKSTAVPAAPPVALARHRGDFPPRRARPRPDAISRCQASDRRGPGARAWYTEQSARCDAWRCDVRRRHSTRAQSEEVRTGDAQALGWRSCERNAAGKGPRRQPAALDSATGGAKSSRIAARRVPAQGAATRCRSGRCVSATWNLVELRARGIPARRSRGGPQAPLGSPESGAGGPPRVGYVAHSHPRTRDDAWSRTRACSAGGRWIEKRRRAPAESADARSPTSVARTRARGRDLEEFEPSAPAHFRASRSDPESWLQGHAYAKAPRSRWSDAGGSPSRHNVGLKRESLRRRS